jgi:hypothetical protein
VIKRISLLITAALLVATMAMAGLAGPAFAAQCPGGGQAENDRGTKSCTTEGRNDRFTKDESVKGSFQTKNTVTTECGGTGSGKCPPGQFR